ncbi:hypothetical protein RRF57_011214 [Xylaria bambusicola]|uniref:PD-(D/E)XK nuclease-like domain-containing protein n=1 Tax=Xylaria bambusicola TaxID=326684 RepID=A0AAN7UTH0_9PEZI
MFPMSVQKWVDSLEPARSVKRRRYGTDAIRANNDFTNSYNVPNSPLPTNSDSECEMQRNVRGRKRTGDFLGDKDQDNVLLSTTPRLAVDRTLKLIPVLPSQIPSRASSPPKRLRSTSPIKTRVDLQKLEKPVQINELEDDAASLLPSDIQSLYTQLQCTSQLQGSIVPIEVHSQVFNHAPPPTAAPDPLKIARAESVLSRIRHIRHQAVLSAKQQRHECAWNNFVHTPLLQLAFDELEPSTSDTGVVSVRLEPVMSVSIARDSMPRVQSLFAGASASGEDTGSVLAWSVSESIDSNQGSDVNSAQIRASSDNRKVDYIVVLDVAKDTALKQTIKNIILSQCDGAPAHVNQTLYPSIYDSPIGLSIETKTVSVSRDPLVQLSIWVAAWHKRMNDLRLSCLRQHIPPSASAVEQPRLVSVTLIVVTGHEWDVYFACDEGSCISILGPLRIGSTSTILQIYVLLASLKAIKEWMKTTYFEGIAKWFECKV